jgi:hypothetical protein
MVTKKAVSKSAAKKTAGKKTSGSQTSGKRAPAKSIKKAGAKKTSTRRAGAKRTATTKMGVGKAPAAGSASELISARIAELGDWRGATLARMRQLIKDADAGIVEEWKWRGTPVWSHGGIVCTGESYKEVVKLTFFKGASLPDPAGLFNSSMEGNVRRAIDIREGEHVNEDAFKALIRAAVELNLSGKK